MILRPHSMSVERFTASELVLSPTPLLQSPFPRIISEHSPCSARVRRCALRRPAAMTTKKRVRQSPCRVHSLTQKHHRAGEGLNCYLSLLFHFCPFHFCDQTRKALNAVDPTLLIPEAEIRRIWADMKQLAIAEHISLLGVSGAVAMQAAESIKKVTHGSLTGLFVAGKIVNRNIFGHYANALTQIHKQGIWASVIDTYSPYVDLAWGNFTSSRRTWTEQVLNPSRFARFWSKITSVFRRKPPEKKVG